MRSNVATPGYESRPGFLMPGGRSVLLPQAVRVGYAACLTGGDYRRSALAGGNNRAALAGADHRRAALAGAAEC